MMQIVGSQMEWGFKATVWQSWTAARVLYLLGLLCADVC